MIRYFALICIVCVSCSKVTEHTPEVASALTAEVGKIAVKKNIILILVDDIGYEIPGYTGGTSYSTPNINFLAKNGMQFTQCYASPLCSPSRISLVTGKYNFRNYDTFGVLRPTEYTIANMLKNAGYATCAAGKWQFDGGHNAITSFGFDSYRVTNPFKCYDRGQCDPLIRNYKNPNIYENGNYLPNTATKDKYGEDMIREHAFEFISNNKDKPFFLYWSMNLCHREFGPTPDDAAFTDWDPNRKYTKEDTIWFPSMVKYMDKQVGLLINKLNELNLSNNTIIFFVGDNGTTFGINSMFKGKMIAGNKGCTDQYGTHVPMIAYCPGTVPKMVNKNLVDFTDFVPAFADIADVPKTGRSKFGILDGTSFITRSMGGSGVKRKWVYCYYYPKKSHGESGTSGEWIHTAEYKLYKTDMDFYNFSIDPKELYPIVEKNMSENEKLIKEQLTSVMNGMY